MEEGIGQTGARMLAQAALLITIGSLGHLGMGQAPPRIYEPRSGDRDFAFGADLSFLPLVETSGKQLKANGKPMKGLDIFRSKGFNWIRLRLFVEPVKQGLPNSLAYTLAAAKEAKSKGFRFLLCLHYAQSWADPGKQPTPEEWASLSHPDRVNKVFEYTRDTIKSLREGGALPDMVQIGNEVTAGMLWPDGRVPENWENFAEYLHAGINGMDAGRGNMPRPRVMIHYDQGAKREAVKWFFDHVEDYHVPFDVIGLSYYPFWHGTLGQLKSTMDYAAERYKRDVMVVETAYHWKENGETRGKELPFPETPDGQRQYLEALTQTVMSVRDGRGTGVFWWEPVVLGGTGTRGCFSDDFEALPAVDAFRKFALPKRWNEK